MDLNIRPWAMVAGRKLALGDSEASVRESDIHRGEPRTSPQTIDGLTKLQMALRARGA